MLCDRAQVERFCLLGEVNEKSGEAKGEPLGTGAVEEERQRERDRDRKTGREAEREKVRDGKWARSTF